ncbi:MAG TPA: Fe-S protein assembly co-chaperone HscB [Alphaproteobacteria bacterium]|nr:Fe-S protein assembly co-chaperone HscB [Alphaproteobacteria bacterium]
MAEPQIIGNKEQLSPCWSCKGPVARASLFCETCGAIQPPGAADHFQRLGLARDFALDGDELSRRYLALQSRLHPDRFASKTAKERAASLAQATALNDAYRTLRDPVTRAACLLQLAGATAPTEESGTVSDPELLMESLERREELSSAESPAEVQNIAARAESDAKNCVTALAAAFAANDLAEAARLATRLKYLGKLGEECRARLARIRESAPC